MDPLGLDTWLLVLTAFSLACFTLFALARFSPYEWRNPRPWIPRPDYLVNQFSLANSFWFITGTLLRQGSGVNPKVAHRVLILSESETCLSLRPHSFSDRTWAFIPRDLWISWYVLKMYSSVQGKPNLHGNCDAVYILVLDMSSLGYLADILMIVQFFVHLLHHIWVYCPLWCKITWCHSYWITEMEPCCFNNRMRRNISMQKSESVSFAMLPGKWIDRAVIWTWHLHSADLTPLDSRRMRCVNSRCLEFSVSCSNSTQKLKEGGCVKYGDN